jgi:DNA-binding transcriptional MerR regulator/effector-binding domain-containing protein
VIKIGEFARLTQVTIATLRYYDDVGLLKPIEVDKSSGYRYYSVSQLPRLNRILALKDLGFTLEQIEQMLNGLTLEQLRGMLKMKRAEVEQQIAQEQDRLMRIAARLVQIEMEDKMPDYDVVLKTVPSVLIASRKVTIPANDQVPVYLDAAYSEVYDYAKGQGAKALDYCFALWHQPAEVHANEVAEAAAPIDRRLPGTDKVQVYELPQTQVVSVVRQGDFKGFVPEHTALLKWTEANGYRIVGPYREIYINHNPNNMAEAATEIQYPVEK